MQMSATSLYNSKLPQWIENDRKVLRFNGYYQEHISEQPNENYRIHKTTFLYYLEDNTLQISEPRQDNSGLPQVRARFMRAAVRSPITDLLLCLAAAPRLCRICADWR